MMAAKTPHARLKLALIPVLALTLVYVLTSSRTSDDTSPPETSLVATPPAPTPPNAAPAAPAVTNSAATAVAAAVIELPPPPDWPILPLEDVLAHNPFAWPEELAPRAPEIATMSTSGHTGSEADPSGIERQKLLDQLAATGVSAYYVSNQGAVALVGTRVLRVGDVIDGQLRVQNIEPEQITYEAVAP